MAKKAAKPKWSEVKRQIQDWEPRELVALVKDLFDASPENRRFLAARFLQDDLGPEVLEPYRERIHEAFYARNGSTTVTSTSSSMPVCPRLSRRSRSCFAARGETRILPSAIGSVNLHAGWAGSAGDSATM